MYVCGLHKYLQAQHHNKNTEWNEITPQLFITPLTY